MDHRDEELDLLLEPLRGERPSPIELERWKKALDGAAKRRIVRSWQPIWQLAAACVLGTVVGAWMISALRPTQPCSVGDTHLLAVEKFSTDATIERIHIKLE